jgi:sulfotransferase family protein
VIETYPMPVVFGSGRCGSTLLRLMLDSHPQMAVPPETAFLPGVNQRRAELGPDSLCDLLADFPTWPDFHLDPAELRRQLRALAPFSATAGIRCFYRLYAQRHGKTRWGDKTPVYGHHLPAIQALLPEARFIHLVRDGRDVALSLRSVWFAPGQDAATLARYWRDCIEGARAGGRQCRHFLEIRYEDLLRDPVTVLRQVCAFIELPFSPAMLEYPIRAAARLAEVQDQRLPDGRVISREQRLAQHPLLTHAPRLDRAGHWPQDMSAPDVALFDEIAGDLLEELGYDRRAAARRDATRQTG